jgi:tRNA-intron endonuclease
MSENEFDDDDYEYEEKISSKEENLLAWGYIKETKIILKKGQWQDLYDNNFFGQPEGQNLILDPEEAILLVERGRIKIYQDEDLTKELEISVYVNYISEVQPDFWQKYIVYKDLRSRGYVVRAGYGELAPYRRYPRGAKPNKAQSDTFVFPFAEGSHLDLNQLEFIVKQAQANRKTLILGMVDRSGDVTYYKTSEFVIPINTEKFEFMEEQTDNSKSKREKSIHKRIDSNSESISN